VKRLLLLASAFAAAGSAFSSGTSFGEATSRPRAARLRQ